MNLDERIERRLRSESHSGAVRNLDAVTPGVHVEEVVGRGPTLERLLDALDPAFAGSRPPTTYVHGPKGAGKSAVVVALFDRLAARDGHGHGVIHTSTRAADPSVPAFVRVDARTASTRFGLYREVLAALTDGSVPKHGVGTDEVAARLREETVTSGDVVVAIDHVGEPETHTAAAAAGTLREATDALIPVCVGREPPAEIDWDPEETISFDAYRRHALVDVVTARASTGLARGAITHDQVREIAEWADGDAHDALAALFGAAVIADREGHASVSHADVDRGIGAVPKPCVALGRLLSLPSNRQRVLRALVELDDDERESVADATGHIAGAEGVDLSPATVRRVLYELAEVGVLERVTVSETNGKGRPPSRVVPRFPTLAFVERTES